MESALLLEYGWVLLVLIGLEGILAADNAVVMAVMVKHLPAEQQKKALFYGLFGAFIFRFLTLFVISYLADYWQVQAIGAVYLFYIAGSNLIKKSRGNQTEEELPEPGTSSFWWTVLKVELADIAFAIDSMLAAVALAVTLTPSGWFRIGGIDGGQFMVMFLGGIIGLVIMRFAATWFVRLLKERPALERAAFIIVGWVGVKLAIFTFAHPQVGILDPHFPEFSVWKISFWAVLLLVAIGGYIVSGEKIKIHEHG
ncbi:TerC family protein [Mesobacillus foraminis]|uniref:TerC family protein n=1 Tax=Mesobacillus foraminis TaxID=279826 RepID=UPI001BE96141|nr:TerC family protein [Mesobacillus foraminis]MBT2756239.1 TerC family protein [Mesobacillus foraminis]